MSQSLNHPLVDVLKRRFESHPVLHPSLNWTTVEARLKAHPEALDVLLRMEESGGEPDVIAHDPKTGSVIFADVVPESPKGRRSLCYDRQAWESRKENKPVSSVIEMGDELGITLMDEATYYDLQSKIALDLKSSSWIYTPEDVRRQGGGLFCERRFGRTFTAANGADSYFGNRGFRGILIV